MWESGYYPPGAEHDPNAPWNEVEVPEKDFDVTCSQSLSKTVTVCTNNYIPGASGCDYEPDGEGGYSTIGWHEDDDTSDTDWAQEYHENDYHTPAQLLELFKDILVRDLENGNPFKSEKYTKQLIEECEGWTEDETDFERD